MSIAFGIYDFFSYTVPGVIYILVANQLLVFLKLPSIDTNALSANFGSALLWVIIAYVAGQLMDSFAIQLYYLINKFSAETKAMKDFKEKLKSLPLDFTINDRKTLFSVIRHNNLDLALYIDNFKAVSFMLNNISLGLLLLSLEKLFEMAVGGFSFYLLVIIVLSLLFSYVAITRSALFNEWHWSAVYQHARHYGKSIPEMYNSSAKKKAGK
jgi:hypothetical protein